MLKFLIAGSIGLILLLLIFSHCGITNINTGEVGLVTEFGKIHDRVLEPGLQFYNPFTESVTTTTIQRQTVRSEDDSNTLTRNPVTSDQLQIQMNYSVIYQIKGAQVVHLRSTVKGDPFAALVSPRVNEAVRAIVATYRSDEVTSKSQEIQQKITALADKLVGNDITIVDVPITHIELPQVIREAVERKQLMDVQSKEAHFELAKEKIKAEIKIVQAQAEAKSFSLKNQALAKSPQLVKMTIAEKWDGKLPTTMLAGNTMFSLKE